MKKDDHRAALLCFTEAVKTDASGKRRRTPTFTHLSTFSLSRFFTDVMLWYNIGLAGTKCNDFLVARFALEQVQHCYFFVVLVSFLSFSRCLSFKALAINARHWPSLNRLLSVLQSIGDSRAAKLLAHTCVSDPLVCESAKRLMSVLFCFLLSQGSGGGSTQQRREISSQQDRRAVRLESSVCLCVLFVFSLLCSLSFRSPCCQGAASQLC
jgi:hypothetical protein